MRNCPTYRRDIVRTMSTINKYEEMNVLCGSLRISAFSALTTISNAEDAEIRREPQRKTA